MPLHPAWVKNISRRVLWAALEKDISKADRLAMEAFFEKKCAYCEGPLAARWHADHLLSVDSGGFNHVSNRVPACPRCNEHEKREMAWLEFLEWKCGTDTNLIKIRKERIERWTASRKYTKPPVTEEQRQAWKTEVENLAKAIDAAWGRLRNKGLGD
jgi:hypothetical protein